MATWSLCVDVLILCYIKVEAEARDFKNTFLF